MAGLFLLEAEPESVDSAVEGPIGIRLRLKYAGTADFEMGGYWDMLFDYGLAFEFPEAWALKKSYTDPHGFELSGPLYQAVSPGQRITRTVFLHDYFEKLSIGPADLSVKAEIWAKDAEKPIAVVSAKTHLNILPPDPDRFRERIRSIASKLDAEKDLEARKELYRRVASLSHPDVIPLLVRSLHDRPHVYYDNELMNLCLAHQSWDAVVEFLRVDDFISDRLIFNFLKTVGVKLSEEQLGKLRTSPSFRTRLYCLEVFGPSKLRYYPYERDSSLITVEAEIGRFNEDFERIKKALAAQPAE